jgi:hypothetical protein
MTFYDHICQTYLKIAINWWFENSFPFFGRPFLDPPVALCAPWALGQQRSPAGLSAVATPDATEATEAMAMEKHRQIICKMGHVPCLMGFYSDSMGYEWDIPSGNLM